MATQRIYGRGEKPAEMFSRFKGEHQLDQYFYLRFGRIVEIDQERYMMKIIWLNGGRSGSPGWMPISFPYVGPAGCMGALPEEGAFGIFGFYDEGNGRGIPIPLAYIPVALAAAVEFNQTKRHPDAVSNDDENIVNRKFRKLTDGDMIMSSALGGQVFVNAAIELGDAMQDAIVIRPYDQSIISTSIGHYVFADGASVSSGPIIRNNLSIYNSDGTLKEGLNARSTTLPNGKDVVYIIPFGDKIDYESQFYPEYRIDVDAISDGVLDQNDINSHASTSTRDPIVTLALGTYVGAKDNSKDYGKILRPSFFSSSKDSVGQFQFLQCMQNKGLDEVSALSMAYALHFHKSGCFIGVDKEGQYFMHLPASMANPSGAGRSMSILAQGSRKEVWGMDAEGVGWDYATRGSVKWNIGTSSAREKRRSIDIRTDSGIYIEAGGNDDDGFAKQEKILGESDEYVAGNKTEEVVGNSNLTINGLKTEIVFGSASAQYHVDKSENVSGVSTEVVVKEKQCRFGKRKTTITGDDEYIIQKGNLTETIQIFGNRKTTFQGPGGIEESILTGNKKVSIKAGNYEVNVTAGNITIKTSAGSLKLNANLTAELVGLTGVKIKGSSVKLGMSPIGKVITTTSHKDYVTGAPLMGAMTISAGP